MVQFFPGQPRTRRSLLGAALGATFAATPLVHRFPVSARQTVTTEGDCSTEPAVQLLLDWRSGQPIYATSAEYAPQPDWVPYRHPALLTPYLMPPGWTGIVAWADSFNDDGEPIWQEEPLTYFQLAMARLISPDGDAWFDYVAGSIQNVLLTMEQAQDLAKVNVVGPGERLRSVCSIEEENATLGPGWLAADRHSQHLLMTFGNVVQLPAAIGSATVVSINAMYGPRREMESLMMDSFLRILFQFLGGTSDPEEEDDGEEDDGEDEDDGNDD